jgi:phage virion morphogenesis protein
MTVSIKVEDKEVMAKLGWIGSRLADLSSAMRTIGQIIRTSIVKNFEEGGRPRWKESARAVREGGRTLSDTGRLRSSIHPFSGSNFAGAGTDVKYAAIHHFGGATGPHDIFPVKAKALFWPGAKHPVKKVRHPGSKIPARPFMVIQDEDWDEIKSTLADHVFGK